MQLKDRKVIVTGGPTREWIDPVRFISNPSSGKMGVAIAQAATKFGCETVFIHGPIESKVLENTHCKTKSIESTHELLEAVVSELQDYAVLIMAAAPADYKPLNTSDKKIKKSGGDLTLQLIKNPDILKEVALMRAAGTFSSLFVAGFAAETHNVEEYAKQKLTGKNLDMICLNDVSKEHAGFGSDTNTVIIYNKNGTQKQLPIDTKEIIGNSIIDYIHSILK